MKMKNKLNEKYEIKYLCNRKVFELTIRAPCRRVIGTRENDIGLGLCVFARKWENVSIYVWKIFTVIILVKHHYSDVLCVWRWAGDFSNNWMYFVCPQRSYESLMDFKYVLLRPLYISFVASRSFTPFRLNYIWSQSRWALSKRRICGNHTRNSESMHRCRCCATHNSSTLYVDRHLLSNRNVYVSV